MIALKEPENRSVIIHLKCVVDDGAENEAFGSVVDLLKSFSRWPGDGEQVKLKS